ncbi:hypothetical protein NQ318_007133 [Aromia moschata]|uniref:Uncharacterized protein n=1 Tax=Aromia moschata TaxID=1265417 RepID=A0AAV8XQY0_9CUCU|nr:hypothetical protein NQ318_007133 [Aromia moschata]
MSKRKKRKIDDPSLILSQLQEHDSKGRFPINVAMDAIKSEPRGTCTFHTFALQSAPVRMHQPRVRPNLSPHQYNIGATPSPEYNPMYIPQGNPTLPGGSPQPPSWLSPSAVSSVSGSSPQPPTWNIPLDFGHAGARPVGERPVGPRQSDEHKLRRNCGDAEDDRPHPLPEIGNLSFSDVAPNLDHNMTDSLTRLANNTIDSLCQLNSMYPSQASHH